MSLPSYHCSTSRYILMITFPLPHGHLSTSCAGCTSGCNQYFNVKELLIKNPTRLRSFLKLHTHGICFTKIGKNSHSVKSFLLWVLGVLTFRSSYINISLFPKGFTKIENIFKKSKLSPLRFMFIFFRDFKSQPNLFQYWFNLFHSIY